MTVYLTTADLAARWGMNPGSVTNCRNNPSQPHPGYLKTGSRVLYQLAEIESFEARCFVPARAVIA